MTVRTDAELTQSGYPTQSEMKTKFNMNVLFYWSYYDTENYTFNPRFLATDIIEEDGKNITFAVAEQNNPNVTEPSTCTVQVPLTYFTDTENWQMFTMNTVAQQLSLT